LSSILDLGTCYTVAIVACYSSDAVDRTVAILLTHNPDFDLSGLKDKHDRATAKQKPKYQAKFKKISDTLKKYKIDLARVVYLSRRK